MSDFSRLMEMARGAGLSVSPPAMVTVPYVSPETAGVGDTLSCTSGTWDGAPDSYTYSWRYLDAAEIGTGNTYVVAATDAGHSLVCVVTATNSAGSAIATPSNAVVIAAARAAEPGAASAARHESTTRTRTTHTETTR